MENKTIEVPVKFHSINKLIANNIKQNYLSALNADRRSELEEQFIKWVEENNLVNFD